MTILSKHKPTIYECNNELTFENGVLKFTKYATFETLTRRIQSLNGISARQVKVIDYTEISDVLVGKPYSLKQHFANLKKLVKIKFGTNFDTSNVDDMCEMFLFCESIESLDLSSFNTSNVKTMEGMFRSCRELKKIVFGVDFNADIVTNMSRMFFNCASLKSLDLSTFNAPCVLDMSYMFYDCHALRTLDMSSFTSNLIQNMEYMFGFCVCLKSINMVNISHSPEHINAESMFYMCSALSSVIMNLNNCHSAIEHELHRCTESHVWHGTRNIIRTRLSVIASESDNEVFSDASESSSERSSDTSSVSSSVSSSESSSENLTNVCQK